jgi:high-affinity iron transporter
VLGFLSKSGNHQFKKYVYSGAITAVMASAILALLFRALSIEFEGATEQIFEGVIMIATSIMLGFMILWLVRFKTNVGKIKSEIATHANRNYGWGIFSLVFLSVFREGVETVLFFIGLNVQANPESLIGGAIGFIVAFVLCYAIFAGTVRLNFKTFFNITSALLLLIAAGLMAHGVHEMNEAKIIPEVIEHVWDVNPDAPQAEEGIYPALHEKGLVGRLLTAVFGYNGNPSLTEVIAYWMYLIIVALLWYSFERRNKQAELAKAQ